MSSRFVSLNYKRQVQQPQRIPTFRTIARLDLKASDRRLMAKLLCTARNVIVKAGVLIRPCAVAHHRALLREGRKPICDFQNILSVVVGTQDGHTPSFWQSLQQGIQQASKNRNSIRIECLQYPSVPWYIIIIHNSIIFVGCSGEERFPNMVGESQS